MNNLLYWVWLSSIRGVGPVKSKKMLDHFKEPLAIWKASLSELSTLSFLNKKDILNIFDNKTKDNAKRHLENIYKNGITVVPITDDLYPENLKNIYDPPIVLYKKGSLKKDEKYLGIVGSRNASKYGKDVAERIGYELSQYGITIVSGMARGIDSFAHKGAINAKGRTMAVLGCGLDIVYPYENKALMQEVSQYGAVLSEYLPGVSPLPINFPARNRIISGMSYGIIVVEAGEKSGSLITANFALEQGREVFAIPGNIGNYNSKGTNNLIKDGAKLVTNLEDVLEEIRIFKPEKGARHLNNKLNDSELLESLSDDEKNVLQYIKEEPLHIDSIAQKTGLSIQAINAMVIMLELKGTIEQLPGKMFRAKVYF